MDGAEPRRVGEPTRPRLKAAAPAADPGRPRTRPDHLIADKAYSHPSTRRALRRRGRYATIADAESFFRRYVEYDFTADLELDADGLVVRYPRLAERVAG